MSVPMYDALGDVERGYQESLLSSLFQVKVTMNTDNISNLLRSMLEKINYNFAIVKLLQKTCISQKDLKSELDLISENMRGELKGVVEDRETSFDALKRDMVEATRKIIKEEIETSEKEWLNDRVKFHEAVKNETQRIELEMKKQGEETTQKIWRLIDEVEELKSYQLGIEGRMKNDKYHNSYINNRINRIDEMLNHMVIEGRSSSAPLERTESPKNEEVVPLSPTKVQFEEQVGDEVIIPPLNLKNFNLDIPRLSNSDLLPKRPTMSKSLSETTMNLDLKHKLPHVKYYQQDNVEKLQEEINTIYESLKKMKEQINTSLQQNTIVEGVGKKVIPILDSLRKELEDKISLKVDKRDLVYYLEKKADGFEVIKMRTNYDSALALFGRVENEIREQSVNYEKLAYALRRQLRGELTLKEMDRIVSQFQQRDHRRNDSDNPSPVSHQIDDDQFTPNEQEMSTPPPYLSVRRSTKLVQGALRPKSAMSLRSISPPVNLVGVDGVIYKGVLPSDNDLYKGQILYGGTKSILENNYSMRTTDSRTSSPVPPFFDHDMGKPPSRLEDRSMSPYLHESNAH